MFSDSGIASDFTLVRSAISQEFSVFSVVCQSSVSEGYVARVFLKAT